MKKSVCLFLAVLALPLSGCVALFVGAAAGVGTATWLSGKLIQTIDSDRESTVKAVKQALSSLKMQVKKQTIADDVTQIISEYTDGRTVWIDIRPLPDRFSRIEIRVGVTGDKDAAQRILQKVQSFL